MTSNTPKPLRGVGFNPNGGGFAAIGVGDDLIPAALVRAAPDLLAALELVFPFLDDAPRLDYNEDRTIMWLIHARETVRAAIQKATNT